VEIGISQEASAWLWSIAVSDFFKRWDLVGSKVSGVVVLLLRRCFWERWIIVFALMYST
jgi:hypothetical protein